MGEKYITTNKRTGFGRKGYVTQRKLKMQVFFCHFFIKCRKTQVHVGDIDRCITALILHRLCSFLSSAVSCGGREPGG